MKEGKPMSEIPKIRVLSVDDHEIFRGGIEFMLLAFDDIELVGQAQSGEEALRMCAELEPNVILMDMMMPGMDGAATTQAVKQQYPHVQIIALTSFQEGDMVKRAMQAGAIGYLLKGVSIDELVAAIRAAIEGRPTLAVEATQALIQAATPPVKVDYELTQRQLDVLEHIVEGRSNIDIAERMVLSPSTVRHHVSEILSKLGASNRAEAAVIAMKHNLTKQ
jgi:NarL family two-component system response regulator LiaR